MNNNDLLNAQDEVLKGEKFNDFLTKTDIVETIHVNGNDGNNDDLLKDDELLKDVNNFLKNYDGDNPSTHYDPFEGEVFDAEEAVCMGPIVTNQDNEEVDYVDTLPLGEPLDIELEENPLVESKEPIDEDSFLKASDMDTLKYLQKAANMNDINRMMDTMKSQCDSFLTDSNDEIGIHLDNEALKRTEEEIKALTAEEIIDIYTINGEQIGVITASDKDDISFRRDYLLLRKQTIEATQKFDEEIAKINAEIAECQEEFDKAVNTYGNVSNLVSERLDECIANAKSEDDLNRFLAYRKAFDNAFDLDNVVEFAKSPRGRGIIGAYRNDAKSNDIYKKYLKVCERIRSNNNLNKYSGIEAKFLPAEYNERPDIFLFTIIMMVSMWHNKPIKKTDIVFLSQFNINIRDLFYDNFNDDEKKAQFIENIRKVIEVFM